MISTATTLKLYPVCECGHVARDLTMKYVMRDNNSAYKLAPSMKFTPEYCSKCNRKIETVECINLNDVSQKGALCFDYNK